MSQYQHIDIKANAQHVREKAKWFWIKVAISGVLFSLISIICYNFIFKTSKVLTHEDEIVGVLMFEKLNVPIQKTMKTLIEKVNESPPIVDVARTFRKKSIKTRWLVFDDDLISNVLRMGRYFQPEQISNIIEHVTEEKPNVFDLGTNLGTETIPVALYVKSMGGEVLGVEGNTETFSLATANLYLNEIENAVILNKLIDSTSGEMKWMSEKGDNRGDSRVGSISGLHEKKDNAVETISVDDLFVMNKEFFCRVNVWKLDIQGYEGKAFLGAEKFLKECPPCYITTELLPAWLKTQGTPMTSMINHLRQFDYEIYHNGNVYNGDGSEYGKEGFDDFQIIHNKSCKENPTKLGF